MTYPNLLRRAVPLRYLPVLLALVFGVGLAVAAFLIARSWERDATASAFTLAAKDRVSALRATLRSYLEQMETLGEFHASTPAFSREGWKTFVAPKLKRHPGISSLEWIPRVPDARRAESEEQARRDGYPDFHITRRLRQGVMVPAEPSAEYFPVYFQEPLVGGGIALGFDLGSEPKRREALERARDRGGVIVTDRIILVEETSHRFSVLLFRPVYERGAAPATPEERRAALAGFVLGVFRIGDLVEEALAHLEPQGVEVTLFDASANAADRYLYHSGKRLGRVPGPFLPDGVTAGPERLEFAATLEMGGHDWRTVVTPAPEFGAEVRHTLSWGLLAGLLLSTAALFAHLVGELRRSERIERQVSERTAEIRQVNASLEQAIGERARAEDRLRVAHDALEVRVAERTAELTRTNELLRLEIEERRRLEERLVQSQKMESIGRLAGGVAHEFNNLLTAVLGYADLAADELHDGDPIKSYLVYIRQGAERGAALTQQLLAFARKQLTQPKRVDPNAVMIRMEGLLRHLLAENIELVTAWGPGIWPVQVDPGQFEQVVLNLVMNARDAMPGGGRLTLETANVTLGDGQEVGKQEEVVPGPYVMLAVGDSGVGMSPEVIGKLFEPFFTTKGPDRGTGLGLATCYGILRQNRGYIAVTSEAGKGSVFRAYLPRLEESAPEGPGARGAAAGAVPAGSAAGRGTETLLLVEDAALVRAMAAAGLRKHGYRVLEAAGGEEALRVAEAHGDGIDLLVTDVVMQRMGGRELADRMVRQRPGLRVLYMSGYTRESIGAPGLPAGGIRLLQKPFEVQHLVCKVREVLDERPG
ncbi:MAG: CHASE domain-containing protein [Planctomycetes bacterium]|nr:CHASE domain-containing protein [Planctomycetota bacterium]